MDFDAYIKDLNRGDMRQVMETWYTPDARFQSGRYNARNREEIADMLHFLYDGVRATLRPQTVMHDGDHVFAEIDSEHQAHRDRLDYPLGPLHAGEKATMKIFCLLKIRDGRICEFRVAEWPADIGIGQ
jgi:hypothetical protein